MVCNACDRWVKCAAVTAAEAGRGGVAGRECMRALAGGVGLPPRSLRPAPGVELRDTAYRAVDAWGSGKTSDMVWWVAASKAR